MVICPGGEKDYPCNKWYLVGTGSSLTLSSSSDFLLKLNLTDGRNHTYTDEKPVQISSLFKTAAEQTRLNLTAALNCYPNPFNSSISISLSLLEEANVSVFIYNAKGQKVKTIFNNGNMKTGEHTLVWDGQDDACKAVPSGIYLCLVKLSESESIVRLSLVR